MNFEIPYDFINTLQSHYCTQRHSRDIQYNLRCINKEPEQSEGKFLLNLEEKLGKVKIQTQFCFLYLQDNDILINNNKF